MAVGNLGLSVQDCASTERLSSDFGRTKRCRKNSRHGCVRPLPGTTGRAAKLLDLVTTFLLYFYFLPALDSVVLRNQHYCIEAVH